MGHMREELTPEMSDEEFTEKRTSFVMEVDELVKKYGIHGIVLSFGFESGTAMKGATGILGCSDCCKLILQAMVKNGPRTYAEIDQQVAKIMNGGPQVH